MTTNDRKPFDFAPYRLREPFTMNDAGFYSKGNVGLLGLLLMFVLSSGCLGSRAAEELPPDQRFGHRYEEQGPEGRRTITIAPPDSDVRYFYYPAPYDTVIVRPAPFVAGVPVEEQDVAIEVLVKGAFPDACTELHDIQQERTAHIITATLEMRKPQGAICASVRRPYRFYVMLEGRYSVGHYTLKLNDLVVPFQIRPPPEETP